MKKEISELTEALLTLEGLLYGISADGIISDKELAKLKNWKKQHFDTIRHHPVGDLFSIIDSTTEGRILLEHEREFIEQFCQQYGACEDEDDQVLCDSIRLKGYIEGILMDKKIYEAEIRSLRTWLMERPHLKTLSVYSEILDNLENFIQGRQISSEELFYYLKEIEKEILN